MKEDFTHTRLREQILEISLEFEKEKMKTTGNSRWIEVNEPLKQGINETNNNVVSFSSHLSRFYVR